MPPNEVGDAADLQIQDHAFNKFSWSIKIPGGIDGGLTALNAYKPTTTPWAQGAAAMEARGEHPWRESLSLTPAEKDVPSEEAADNVARYLLVGFTLPGLRPAHSSGIPPKRNSGPSASNSIPPALSTPPICSSWW
ncbi:hypothetical protein C8A01DRAFT_14599 [Parachaetomium inaequale]|uniref:Uncharacterized protein n=1 Tax=Parachaetomium inaequale TaxID=2588326 RepID=A0AAN6PMR9_9PEZI|nr:hypothetical protein C8A01DRAFT_14599 [Parachaetomium inaequale]